jgi:septum formation protein
MKMSAPKTTLSSPPRGGASGLGRPGAGRWHDHVYLASQSPRRAQLLGQIGVRFELLLPRPDEDAEALEAEVKGELPADYVERVTRAKLQAARRRLTASGRPVAPILCSDTTVALGRRIFGKPMDAADARGMLSMLAGRTHRVITAVAVSSGTRTLFAMNTSRVTFAPMGMHHIDRYVASGEPFGKAGAYAIQSGIAAFIERIDGSYSSIMGLPLFETAHLLRQARVRF